MMSANESPIDPRELIRNYIEQRFRFMSMTELHGRLEQNPVDDSMLSQLNQVEKMIQESGDFQEIHDAEYMDEEDYQTYKGEVKPSPDPVPQSQSHETARDAAIEATQAETKPVQDNEDDEQGASYPPVPETPQEIFDRKAERAAQSHASFEDYQDTLSKEELLGIDLDDEEDEEPEPEPESDDAPEDADSDLQQALSEAESDMRHDREDDDGGDDEDFMPPEIDP